MSSQVAFLAHAGSETIFLSDTAATLSMSAPKNPQTARSRNYPALDLLSPLGAARVTTVQLRYLHANPHPRIVGIDRLPGIVNYLIGKDPRQWHTNIPTYARVMYRDVYPGINLVYYGQAGHLEYDWVVSPGASPAAIQLGLSGAHDLRLDHQGSLVLFHTGTVLVKQERPVVYQIIRKQHRTVTGRYQLLGSGRLGIGVGAYDHRVPLVVDPTILFSTYLGGSGADQGQSVAVDSSGSAYITGSANSPNYPTVTATATPVISDTATPTATGTPIPTATPGGPTDTPTATPAAINTVVPEIDCGLLLNCNLSGIAPENVYEGPYGDVPYWNGDGANSGYASAAYAPVDWNDTGFISCVNVKEYGNSTGDFLDASLADNKLIGCRAYRLWQTIPSPGDGTLCMSGGVDNGMDGDGLYVNGGGPIFSGCVNVSTSTQLMWKVWNSHCCASTAELPNVEFTPTGATATSTTAPTQTASPTTTPTPIPTLVNQPRGGLDVVVSKLSPSGSSLVYSTYLGGGVAASGASSPDDIGNGIAVTSNGDAYVTGQTESTDFPVTAASAAQPVYGGDASHVGDAFLVKLNATGNALLYGSYLGTGTSYGGNAVALDGGGAAYVAGTKGNTASNNSTDAFVAKLDPSQSGGGSLVFMTDLGGASPAPGATAADDAAQAIALDQSGHIYVSGNTESTDFPVTSSAYHGTISGSRDAFVTELGASGSLPPLYSTYLGGTGNDYGAGIGVDSAGDILVTGTTASSDFPIQGIFGPAYHGGWEAFAAKLNPSATGNASLLYGGYLGGSGDDVGQGLALDAQGDAFLVGYTNSPDFPQIPSGQGAPPGGQNVFVAVVNSAGSALLLSSILGGSGDDYGRGIAVDGTGAAYVVGSTSSTNFPLQNPQQAANGGSNDIFVTKIAGGFPSVGSSLAWDQTRCGCNSGEPATRYPVNTRTGNYFTSATDLALSSPGPALAWTRIYNSQATGDADQPGILGYGWQHPYGAHLVTSSMPGGEPGVAIVVSAQGNRERFTTMGGGRYQAYPGVYSTLVGNNDGSFTQTFANQTQLTFTATGQLAASGDGHGGQLTLAYTGSQLTRITDANNAARYLALDYYSNGTQLQDVRDPAGRMVQYTYAASGDLQQVTDVMGRNLTYQYDDHLLTEIDNNLGQKVEQQSYDNYTPAGRVISQTLQDGSVLSVSYTPTATTITTTGPGGATDTMVYQYDPSTNLLTGIVKDGVQVQQSQFDQYMAPGAMVDGNGNSTQISNNSVGLPVSVTNALSQTSTVAYDSLNRPITATDTLGRQTVLTYDSNNNLVQVTSGITTTSPLSATTRYTYTTILGSQLIQDQTDPDGVDTHYAYDATGQVSAVTVGYGTPQAQSTGYGHDSVGRVITTTVGLGTPLARVNVTVYNPDNTVAKTILNEHTGTYDPSHPDQDIVTRYGYDGLGRQVWTMNTLGQVNAVHYNPAGQVDWTLKDLSPVSLDGNGNPILPSTPPAYTATLPDANVATLYGYDGLERTSLITQTGILTGTFTLATKQFSAATTRTTQIQYDAQSRPITTTANLQPGLPVGTLPDVNVQTVTKYDNAGNITWQRDALGRWTETKYDALNRPYETIQNYENGDPTTVDPTNASWATANDTDLITYTTYNPDATLATTISNYVHGTFAATAPITDTITAYAYDQLGRQTTSTENYDPPTLGSRTDTNRVSTTTYAPLTGLVSGTEDALGRWASLQYDGLGRVTTSIANCTDGSGNPLSTGCAAFDPAHPDRNVPSTSRYDALGREDESVDALGHVTHIDYDGLGRAADTIQNYVANGPVNSTTNVKTTAVYDGLGQTLQTLDADGNVTTFTYDGLGDQVSRTDPLTHTTRMGYDGTGTLRWEQSPGGQVTVSTVDGLGRVVSTVANYQSGGSTAPDQDLTTSTTYDAVGRTLVSTDPSGNVTAFTYDLLDHQTSVTNNFVPNGGTCSTPPCNVVTQYQYDRVGNRIATTDPNGHTRTSSYDAAGEQVSATDPLGRTTTMAYDLGGRLVGQQDARGAADALSYAYDGLDRLTQTSAANLPAPISQRYDALGQRTGLTDSTGATSFAYDPLGRVTQVQAPVTGTVGYGYDGTGQRTSLTYPDGSQLGYQYTPAGQLQNVTQSGLTLAGYTYDSAGRLQAVSRSNGTSSSYGYDGADRLTSLQTTKGSTLLSTYQYQPNRIGQTTVLTETVAPAGGGNLSQVVGPAGVRHVGSASPLLGVGTAGAGPRATSAARAGGRTTAATATPSATIDMASILRADGPRRGKTKVHTRGPSRATPVLPGRGLVRFGGAESLARWSAAPFLADPPPTPTVSGTVEAQDSFAGRTVSSGWGTASDGSTWNLRAGDGAALSVSGNEGLLTSAAASPLLTLGTQAATDAEGLVRFATSNPSSEDCRIVLRADGSATTYYMAGWHAGASTLDIQKHDGSGFTSLASTAGTLTANTAYWIRFRVQGHTLSARYWQDGTPEPTSWTVSVSDSSITGPGTAGIRAWAGSSSGWNLDHFAFGSLDGAKPTVAGTVEAQDSFMGRTVSGGWGTASDGSIWNLRAGDGSGLSVGGNEGQITSASASPLLTLGTQAATDAEGLVRFATDNPGGEDCRIALRVDGSATTYYMAGWHAAASTLDIQKHDASSFTSLASTAGTLTANTAYWIRFRVQGSALSVRYWQDGTTEPTSWTVSVTDTSITGPGTAGIRAYGYSAGWNLDHFAFGSLDGAKPTVSGTVVAQDSLAGRTVSSSWGTASDGNLWNLQTGTSSTISVSGNAGHMGSVGASNLLTLGTGVATDGEGLVRFSTSNPGTEDCRIVMRADGSTTTYYMAGWHAAAATLDIQKHDASGFTSIAATPATLTANTAYWIRFRVQGIVLSARYWQDGTPEPTTWTVSVSDSSITGPGTAGIRAWAGSASGWNIDHFAFGSLDGAAPTVSGTVVAQDSFAGRTVSNGWGTASDGNLWTFQAGTSSTLSVSGNAGHMAPSPNTNLLTLGTATATDGEGLVRFSTSTPGNADCRLVLRADGTAITYYMAGWNQEGASLDIQKHGSGGFTSLAATPATLAANTAYWIRFRVQGTVLSARYWRDGTPEPTTWTVSVSDSSISGPGTAGIRAYGDGATWNSDHFAFGSLDGAAPTATATNTPSPTNTSAATPTATATATATNTSTASPTVTGTATATGTPVPPSTRVITYSYDGLQRLTGAVEAPGSSFAYAYDLAGNRTGVTVNGTQTISHTYNAADQVVGWTYDQAGNLTSDGTTTYSYDALNHLSGTTAGTQSNAYAYNGDGTLVSQTANGTTTNYTQDLAASQSQILAATTGLTSTDYLYGQDIAPLAALSGGVRTWYGTDGQGSVQQTLDDTGMVLGNQSYDPFGQVEAGSSLISPFGYTGELQNGTTGQEYLRARWYQPGSGTLLGVDPALDQTGQPYAYAGNDPVNWSDPSGQTSEPPPAATPTPCGPCTPGTPPAQPEAAPLPGTGTDEIDQLLQQVLDTWSQPVEAGPWEPNGQPVPFYIGTAVHNAIAKNYAFLNRPDRVFTNYSPISAILKEAGFDPETTSLSKKQLASRPDILNLTRRTIYEIKPASAYGGALTQLTGYITAFAAAGMPITPGSSSATGTSGIVSAPGGIAVFASPAAGVILYLRRDGSFSPMPAQATAPSAVSTGTVVLTVVLSVFGLIIRVIAPQGGTGNPALAASWAGSPSSTAWASMTFCAEPGLSSSTAGTYLV